MLRKAISDTLQRVLMVPPKHFTVKYAINPWMKENAVVDAAKAMDQWNMLKATIEREGIKVLQLDQVDGLPDMVFACNGGVARGNKVLLARFKHAERTGEEQHFAAYLKQKLGMQLVGTENTESFEGGGDAIFSDEGTLWAGWGGPNPRTSKKAYDHIHELGNDFDIVFCELVDARFYHLDTCFCPVGARSALWFPPAFRPETQQEIRRRLPDAIAVSETEAQHFVCNSICIRRRLISPQGVAQATREALARLGYTVTEVPMGEFLKSGGACQCLVMKLPP